MFGNPPAALFYKRLEFVKRKRQLATKEANNQFQTLYNIGYIQYIGYSILPLRSIRTNKKRTNNSIEGNAR